MKLEESHDNLLVTNLEGSSGSLGFRNTVLFNSLVDEELFKTKEEDFRTYYELGKLIAQGSYFTIFACTRKFDNERFALKWFKERNE